jgi:curved DNA-binding protein CbpA
MKLPSEQNHYEILEVPRGAGQDEIERAYRLARATYVDDSLAGYSVFEEGDAEALRERIEIAYQVLSDEEARRAYDVSLSAEVDAADARPLGWLAGVPASDLVAAGSRWAEAPAAIDELEEFDDESGEFDGARLRRSRLRQGMELEEIADVTKINPTYLRFIEEERFAELPAHVYVRGFVTAYAGCVGLDPRRVVATYMKRYEVHRGNPQRGRLGGGDVG